MAPPLPSRSSAPSPSPSPSPYPLHSLPFLSFATANGGEGTPDPALGDHGTITELKRGRSTPVTPRRTSKTLTSSNKFESASKSDKCEIRLDADPIQGASGTPVQVARVSNSEATHRGSSSSPPLDLLNCTDEFKSLETDRLLPCDLKNASPSDLQQYDAYLHWYYNAHRGPAPVASLADTASMCLDKEKSMVSLWVKSPACSNVPDSVLDDCIVCYMNTVIKEKGEIEHPFAFDAAECLDKEAELICEWLRRGRRVFTDDAYTLCHNIRFAAADLFITRRKWSFHISAALLGIRKEAEWLIENLKHNSGESISTSMKIRQFALDFLLKKFDELEPCFTWGNKEFIETETSDSEGDDDIAQSQDNNYMGDCCDEDYMKLYR